MKKPALASAIIIAVNTVALLAFKFLSSSKYDLSWWIRADPPRLGEVKELAFGRSVDDLVEAIKVATLAANGGVEPTFTDEERRSWELANPCRSRMEMKLMYERRKHSTDRYLEDNADWSRVLEEYAKLHRTCLRKVGDLHEYFSSKNTSSGCKFAIADSSIGGGLGNRILVVTSTILYAILTQRVVLVPVSTTLPSIICEPFAGSYWVLNGNDKPFPYYPPWSSSAAHLWPKHGAVYERLDHSSKGSPPYSAAMGTYQYQPDARFFCSAEQGSFEEVTWLYFTGCLYAIPKLFATPSFRSILEPLFPNRMVLTHMLRSVMLPADNVWERAQRIDAAYMKHAERRVGIQVRYRYGQDQYTEMNDIVNQRLLDCLIENKVLPKPVKFGDHRAQAAGAPSVVGYNAPVTKVFVASLFAGFYDHLTRTYLRKSTSTGEVVGQVQLTHESTQEFGVEVDIEAFVEILTLSFTDALVVTPLSTYGGLAQAYGGLTPWFIEFRSAATISTLKRAHITCERAQTVDVCYQEADLTYACRYDKDIDRKEISDVVPYVKPCLTVDSETGLQLITHSVVQN